MPTRSSIVQSRHNQRVKALRAALRRGINEAGEIGIEGPHLIEEAMRSGAEITAVFIRDGSSMISLPAMEEAILLPREIFESAVTTESPQGIAALVRAPVWSLDDCLRERVPLLLITAGVQDPGNLGTLIRSSEAFGAGGVLMLPGTVSPWNAKCIRASSGSVFRLPVISVQPSEAFARLRARGIRILAASADGAVPATDADLNAPAAIVIGNEGAGISRELLAECDGAIRIPSPGPVESLNAAVAGSILLYEAARQRVAAARKA